MHAQLLETLKGILQLSIDLWQRKQAGEDMMPHRERLGDVFPIYLRIGSGKIPHDLFLQHGHSWKELTEAVAERKKGKGKK